MQVGQVRTPKPVDTLHVIAHSCDWWGSFVGEEFLQQPALCVVGVLVFVEQYGTVPLLQGFANISMCTDELKGERNLVVVVEQPKL